MAGVRGSSRKPRSVVRGGAVRVGWAGDSLGHPPREAGGGSVPGSARLVALEPVSR